jgi:hypothetical protein
MPAGRYGGWRIPYMGNQSLVQRAFPEIDRKANMINTINNALLRELSDSDDLSITAYFQVFD